MARILNTNGTIIIEETRPLHIAHIVLQIPHDLVKQIRTDFIKIKKGSADEKKSAQARLDIFGESVLIDSIKQLTFEINQILAHLFHSRPLPKGIANIDSIEEMYETLSENMLDLKSRRLLYKNESPEAKILSLHLKPLRLLLETLKEKI